MISPRVATIGKIYEKIRFTKVSKRMEVWIKWKAMSAYGAIWGKSLGVVKVKWGALHVPPQLTFGGSRKAYNTA